MEPISVKVILQGPQGVLFVKNPRGEWELPGGRPEAGESLEQALVREVQEECGLTLNHVAYVGSQSCEVIAHKRVLLVFFYGALPDPQTELCLSEEHTEFGWIDIAGERPARLADFYWEACLAAMVSAQTGTQR